MRSAFEAWAQQYGYPVRRREDKSEEYLMAETQRRWVIWQAAVDSDPPAVAAPRAQSAGDESTLRIRVLNEVLDAIEKAGVTTGVQGLIEVVKRLKEKPAERSPG